MQGGAERQHHTQKRTEAGCVLLAPEIEGLLCGVGTPPTPVLEALPKLYQLQQLESFKSNMSTRGCHLTQQAAKPTGMMGHVYSLAV